VLDELSRTDDAGRMVALADEALSLLARDENPLLWANLNGAAAASRVALANGRYTPDVLERVLSSYEAALTVYTPDATPALWAQTQRNLGATHLGAVNSGLGDVPTHIEAAIDAYTRAIQIPPDQDGPGVFLNAQVELASAFATAANWRGSSAFIDSAGAYAAALGVISRDASPGTWAVLNLRLASALSESGSGRYAETAIRAAEHALELITRETQPADWAEAHLVLGGLYRTRQTGDRTDNLERATRSLESALTVFTAESDPQAWYRTHYNRGPAYLHLRSGDRLEHLRRSIESFGIAIDATPRDRDPATWASLVVSAGQALFESDQIDSAIEFLEAALAALPPAPSSLSWRIANRYLGQAYLERRTGDVDDNLERAIAFLTALQEGDAGGEDPEALAVDNANLGGAYARRTRGEPRLNRDKAIEGFERALAVPPGEGIAASQWFHAQARLALLYLDERAETIGRRRAGADTTTLQGPSAELNVQDPFDLASMASAQAASLESAPQELDLDEEWHVPSMLNEEAALMRKHLDQFLGSGAVVRRTPEQRSALERRRWHMLRLVVEHAGEKQRSVQRTTALFRQVEQGTQAFVLLLRGFAYRAHHFAGVSVTHGGGDQLGEKLEKQRLAAALKPIPIVWISNPVDSGPLDLVEAGMDETALGYRVESGATWASDVETLVRAAAFVVFHNPVTTPGLAREIALVEQLGRLDDAFFYEPGEGQQRFDERAIERIKTSSAARAVGAGGLPNAACRWIEGERRANIKNQIRGITRWANHLAQHRSRASIDLELDACFFLAASIVLLEQFDQLPPLLQRLADVCRAAGDDELPGATSLAEASTTLAGAVAEWPTTDRCAGR
jgi:tetratricopeptide (TPR) repeat protein